MKSVVKIAYLICSILFLIYLALPNPNFPSKLPDALQSDEPADTETPLRRAYFTNLDRQGVMSHYFNEMKHLSGVDFSFITYSLNYPPEEAFTLIRDQTRSTFLEEIVHPFRESIYVNGFEPKEDKDRIFIDEREWKQKIIVRYVPSKVFPRLLIGLFVIIAIPILYFKSLITIMGLKKSFRKIWT